MRVSSNGQTPLHSPVKFYLSLSGFHASPNSSRAREVIVCIMLRIRVNRGESSIVFYVLILLRLQPVHVEIFNVHASRNEKLNYIISTSNRVGGVPIYIIRETKIVI